MIVAGGPVRRSDGAVVGAAALDLIRAEHSVEIIETVAAEAVSRS